MKSLPLKRVQSKRSDSALAFIAKPFQTVSIKWCLERFSAGLALAPGLGKTVVMLIVFGALKRKGLARKVLVLAKRRIIYKTWPDEIAKWGFDHRFAIVHGSQAKKIRALQSDAEVFLMTYESLFWLYRQSPEIYAQFDMLICDESSKIKSWMAKRSKLLRQHLTEFTYRYCLTGSLQPNNEMDLFNPTYALDLGQRLGTFITAYRNRWFYPSG